jgi:hypothetical protein
VRIAHDFFKIKFKENNGHGYGYAGGYQIVLIGVG